MDDQWRSMGEGNVLPMYTPPTTSPFGVVEVCGSVQAVRVCAGCVMVVRVCDSCVGL